MSERAREAVRTLAREGILSFGGRVTELGISFIGLALIARFLGKNDFGSVAIGITTLSMFSTICVLGLQTGVGRYLPRFESAVDRRGVILSAMQMYLPVSLITGAGIFFFATPLAIEVFKTPELALILKISAIGIPFGSTMYFVVGVSQGTLSSSPKVIIQNITLPATRIALIAVVIGYGLEAYYAMYAYMIPYIVGGLLGVYVLQTYISAFSFGEYTRMRLTLLRFSLPLVVTAVMGHVLGQIDTYLLAYFSSIGDVGVYRVVYPLSNLLTIFLHSIGFIFLPVLSQLHTESAWPTIRRLYQVSTKWILLGSLPIFLPFVYFPHQTIGLTFGSEYVAGGTTLIVLSLGFITHAIAGPNSEMLLSTGRSKSVMVATMVAALLNIALNFWLIPLYSFVGAAVATAVSYSVMNLINSIHLYRTTGVRPLSTSAVFPSVGSVLTFTAIYLGLEHVFGVSIVSMVGTMMLFLPIYALLILKLGGIQQEEVDIILDIEDKYEIDLGSLKLIAKQLM